MAYLANFSFEFFYKLFTEDASQFLLCHGAKKSKVTKNSNQGVLPEEMWLNSKTTGKQLTSTEPEESLEFKRLLSKEVTAIQGIPFLQRFLAATIQNFQSIPVLILSSNSFSPSTSKRTVVDPLPPVLTAVHV